MRPRYCLVAVCQDESLPGCNDTDTGLALANMTDAAWANGVGSCIMGAIDRPAIKELLGLGENLRLHSVVAFGYPHPIKATWLPCRTAM